MREKISNILVVTKSEIKKLTIAPATYIVLVVFLLLWFFLFFRQAFLVKEASLRGLFGLLPWLMIIFVSAITMGSIAKEKSEATLELVLTHPIDELELVVGKYVSRLALVGVALLFSLPLSM